MADAATVLEDIKGLRNAARTELLDRYGSLEALALAAEEDLTDVSGIGPAMATSIKQAVADAVAAEAQAEVASQPTADERDATVTSAEEAPVPEPADASPAEDRTAQPVAAIPAQGDTTEASGATATGPGPDDTLPVERVRRDVTEARDQLIGAALALREVVTAALDAGRSQIPDVRRDLTGAADALRDTARSLADAAKELRRR